MSTRAWPPTSLSAYYGSEGFLAQLKSLQRRLQRAHPNIDAETIVFDAAADILVKELKDGYLYNKYLDNFPSEGHFLRYIYEACKRKLIDKSRSFQRRFRQLLEEDKVADKSLGPEALAIEDEERKKTQDLVQVLEASVIKKLPKLDRLILKYRIAGKTFQEIAAILDLSTSTVYRRNTAIMKRLATQVEDRKA